ncbi:MFS transporter [Kineococcus sp. NUM-3379]
MEKRAAHPSVPWRLVLAVYLPVALFSVGQGAALPVVALSARSLGASVGGAAGVVALLGVGQVAAALPAGALVARFGERRAMLLAAAGCTGATAAAAAAPTAALLAAAVTALGAGTAVFGLARVSYLAAAAPVHLRARAMSTLGGVGRIGMFLGPFLGAGGSRLAGTDGAWAVSAVAVLLAGAVLLVLPEPQVPVERAGVAAQPVRAVVRRNLHLLATLGLAALAVQAVRQSRQTVLPLWCEHVGLDPTGTSLVFGLSGAVDMLLFYPAGSAMDRFGRAAVGIPSMLVLGAAHAALPLAQTPTAVLAVAVLMGLGNGMGAGLVMTLGADAAPVGARAAFLGAWRLVTDSGAAAGPLLVGAVAAAVSLPGASLAVTVLGMLAAAGLHRWTPRGAAGSAEQVQP